MPAFFHLLFKALAILVYLFGTWFSDSFVNVFVLCVLLLAFDFWTVKNVSGRLMVGLRWWSEVLDEDTECEVMNELGEQGVIRFDEDEDMFYYPVFKFESGMDTYGHVVEWPLWHALQE